MVDFSCSIVNAFNDSKFKIISYVSDKRNFGNEIVESIYKDIYIRFTIDRGDIIVELSLNGEFNKHKYLHEVAKKIDFILFGRKKFAKLDYCVTYIVNNYEKILAQMNRK